MCAVELETFLFQLFNLLKIPPPPPPISVCVCDCVCGERVFSKEGLLLLFFVVGVFFFLGGGGGGGALQRLKRTGQSVNVNRKLENDTQFG